MAYVADPTNAAKPADGDDASGGAAEFRALKAYLQTLLNNGSSIPVNGYAWQGFRNKLINGNFDVWSRGSSFAAAAISRYLADKWVTTGNVSTVAVSQQAFALGQTAVPKEPRFFHRVVVASVAGAGNWAFLQHRIESVRTFAGQTATLSFYAKADAVKNIAIEFQQNFGTGGSPSADVTSIGVTTKSLTTGFTLYTVTVNVPSIAGKTLGSNGDDYLSVNFWFEAGATYNARTNSLGQQSGTFDIAQVQFEEGAVSTPFELLPEAIIRSQCARYCYTSYAPGTNLGTATSVGAIASVAPATNVGEFAPFSYPARMRKTPVMTFWSPITGAIGNCRDLTTAVDAAATVIAGADTGFRGFIGTPTAARLYSAHFFADADL